jgi:hypothetical protein
MRGAVLLSSVFLLAACGAEESIRGGETSSVMKARSPLYEADATVLESPQHGPMLCLGGVLTSLPPQCGNVPITNWRWEAVEGEKSAAGTTWGSFHVVGTYDGETFTLVRTGPPSGSSDRGAEVDLAPPCPEPAGGWPVRDPAQATQNDVVAADAYARKQPEYVASWVHHLAELGPTKEPEETDPVVYVAMFTGAVGRHEAEIRERWSGPLCVVARDVPTRSEAERLRKQAESAVERMGLQITWSSEGAPGQIAHIGVVADPGGRGQAAMDSAYGPGLVVVVPGLREVD